MAMFAEHNGYICRVMQRCQIAIAGMASSYRPYRWALLQSIPPGTLLQTIPLATPTDHTARHAPAGHTAGHAKTIPLGTQNAAELRSPAARSNQFSSFANALRNSVNASAQASSVAYCWLCAMHSSSSQTLSC